MELISWYFVESLTVKLIITSKLMNQSSSFIVYKLVFAIVYIGTTYLVIVC